MTQYDGLTVRADLFSPYDEEVAADKAGGVKQKKSVRADTTSWPSLVILRYKNDALLSLSTPFFGGFLPTLVIASSCVT